VERGARLEGRGVALGRRALEKAVGLHSIGFAYVSGSLVTDLFHRNLQREGFAHSADDRALLTVKAGF
jgi:hypothetical protein